MVQQAKEQASPLLQTQSQRGNVVQNLTITKRCYLQDPLKN